MVTSGGSSSLDVLCVWQEFLPIRFPPSMSIDAYLDMFAPFFVDKFVVAFLNPNGLHHVTLTKTRCCCPSIARLPCDARLDTDHNNCVRCFRGNLEAATCLFGCWFSVFSGGRYYMYTSTYNNKKQKKKVSWSRRRRRWFTSERECVDRHNGAAAAAA